MRIGDPSKIHWGGSGALLKIFSEIRPQQLRLEVEARPGRRSFGPAGHGDANFGQDRVRPVDLCAEAQHSHQVPKL